MTKIDLTSYNVKPFIDKKNLYNTDFFVPKFAPALTKILHVKEIHWKVTHQESQTLFGDAFKELPMNWFSLSFSYGDDKKSAPQIGYIYFNPESCMSLVHKLLGGKNGEETLRLAKELTSLERMTLTSLNKPLTLCLREALTPMLLLKDCFVETKEGVDLPLRESYFVERFSLDPISNTQMYVLLKTQAFNRKD